MSEFIQNIEITHPDKILFPESKISKLDVAKYYEKVSDKILPFLKGRPVTLVRNPEGINEKGFYQRHPFESFPEYIERVKIKEKSGEKDLYIAIDEVSDLIYLSNLGVLEYHAWLSKIEDLEHPDMLIFDLDPDPKSDWNKVIEAALWLKERLEKQGFKPKARVSGGKGIHVVAYYKEKITWKRSKEFTKNIALELVEYDPDNYLIDLSKAKRAGKVFIDFYRNERGATAVVPYSLRARPGASICMEVNWEDVNSELRPDKFKLQSFKALPGN